MPDRVELLDHVVADDLAAIERAIAAGADTSARCRVYAIGTTKLADCAALHVAGYTGRRLAVWQALVKGARDIDVRDDEGRTPLAHLLARGRADVPAIVALLLLCGADPDALADSGLAPIHHLGTGVKPWHADVVRAIVDHGGDLNAGSITIADRLASCSRKERTAAWAALATLVLELGGIQKDATPDLRAQLPAKKPAKKSVKR